MIDWKQVDELRADMGDAFDEIVEVFLQEVDDGIARLESAPRGPSLAADLHFLKGAALNMGFAAFADICARGEEAAQAGRGQEVDVKVVRDTYQQSREAFLTGLSRRAA